MNVVAELFDLFDRAGSAAYFGEAVSQTAHALQTAHLAANEGAADALVAAALLHDVGHLRAGLPEDSAAQGVDDRHETAGADWLSAYFVPAVTEPVRLHVAAKRYLCAVSARYLAGLSDASRLSLTLQGGPFSAAEAAAFIAQPFAEDAVRLRVWDDQAKVPGLDVPGLEDHRDLLTRALRPEGT
jgi:gamma-butyrobetaine dioxygenase